MPRLAITNLILLCRWHHTAVHEGGITIARGVDGWRFTLPDGSEPRPWQTADTLADLLTANARKAAETIAAVDRFDHPAARTIRPRWAGEPFSVHDCVRRSSPSGYLNRGAEPRPTTSRLVGRTCHRTRASAVSRAMARR